MNNLEPCFLYMTITWKWLRLLAQKLLTLWLKKPQQGKVDVCNCISLHLKIYSMEIQCYSHSQCSSMCINSLRLPLHFHAERKLGHASNFTFCSYDFASQLRTSPILLQRCHLLHLNCVPRIKRTSMREVGLSTKCCHFRWVLILKTISFSRVP